MLRDLHQGLISFWVQFKILVLTYKASNHLAARSRKSNPKAELQLKNAYGARQMATRERGCVLPSTQPKLKASASLKSFLPTEAFPQQNTSQAISFPVVTQYLRNTPHQDICMVPTLLCLGDSEQEHYFHVPLMVGLISDIIFLQLFCGSGYFLTLISTWDWNI